MADNQFYAYKGMILAESEKAVGIGTGEDVEFWLPKSQLGVITYREGGDSSEIRMKAAIEAVAIPEWLAKAKGLAESNDGGNIPADDVTF